MNKDMIGGLGMKPAGLPQREDALRPPVALLTVCALGAFSPQHGVAQHALGMIIGGSNPLLDEKYPERVHLPLQTPDKSARIVTLS